MIKYITIFISNIVSSNKFKTFKSNSIKSFRSSTSIPHHLNAFTRVCLYFNLLRCYFFPDLPHRDMQHKNLPYLQVMLVLCIYWMLLCLVLYVVPLFVVLTLMLYSLGYLPTVLQFFRESFFYIFHLKLQKMLHVSTKSHRYTKSLHTTNCNIKSHSATGCIKPDIMDLQLQSSYTYKHQQHD